MTQYFSHIRNAGNSELLEVYPKWCSNKYNMPLFGAIRISIDPRIKRFPEKVAPFFCQLNLKLIWFDESLREESEYDLRFNF